MQKIILSLGLLLGSTAQGAELYNCHVVAYSKRNSATYQVRAFVGKYGLAKVKLLQTELQFGIQDDELYGYVNGQYNFILGGQRSSGHFESATEKGIIKCSEPQAYPLIFRNKISDTLFIDGMGVHDLNNTCYMGEASLALDYINSRFARSLKYGIAKLESETQDILVQLPHKKCLKDNGQTMHEWECLEYSKLRPKTYELENCYRKESDVQD